MTFNLMNLHKITFWVCAISLLFLAYTNDAGFESNSKRGVVGAMLFIAMIGSLKPSDPFGQKYGGLFRIQFWLCVTFVAILIFMGFHNEKGARYVLWFIYTAYEFRR